MQPEEQTAHMISEANALEISKEIYCITNDTIISTFNTNSKARLLKLAVHPDNPWDFVSRTKFHIYTMW